MGSEKFDISQSKFDKISIEHEKKTFIKPTTITRISFDKARLCHSQVREKEV